MLCFTYTSCEELEGLIDDKKDEKATGEEAFFPKAFADKEVAAWYSWTEKDKDKTKTEAVFLFKDNTFVVIYLTFIGSTAALQCCVSSYV